MKQGLGIGNTRNSLYNLLVGLRAFALGHTHTGTVDGTAILTSSLSGTITNAQLAGSIAATKLAGDITSAYLSSATKTHANTSKWLASSTAGDTELPVFYAPVACVVAAAYAITAANVVGNGTDYNTLYLKKYTAGVLGGTLCTANSGTAGTWLAHQAKTLGSVTGGTLAAGDVLTLAKATVAGGTAIADSQAVVVWYPVAA